MFKFLSHNIEREGRQGRISVSMHDARLTLDDLQEIHVTNSYDDVDAKPYDTLGLRFCSIV
jgi:hypothetical protein